MKVRIRRARETDVAAIEAMDTLCFMPEPVERVHINRPNEAWWIGEDEHGEPVCYAGAKIWKGTGGESALYMHRAGVLPGARGKGLQRRLIAARVQFARRAGISEVWTYTAHTSIASANNLIRAGFTLWVPAAWGYSRNPMKPVGDTAWLYWRKASGAS